MIKYNFLKSILLFLILQMAIVHVQAQSFGNIQVETYLTRVSHNSDMPNDYENYYHGSPHTRPDMYYFMNSMHIFNPKGQWVGWGGTSFEKFYLNETSWYHNINNHKVINKTFYYHNLVGYNYYHNKFDLRKKRSLRVYMGYSANEDDYGMSPPMNGDDDYRFVGKANNMPFTDFARNGDSYTYKTLTGNAPGNIGYGFRFNSRYVIDAVEPQLRYLNTNGQEQTIFCNGEQMKVSATHKIPFSNGYFRWERNDGGGWYHIGNAGHTITQTATSSNVSYRARLIASSSTYGVSSFRADGKGSAYTSTATNALVVFQKFDDILFEVADVCPGELAGSVEVTELVGGTIGENYSVIFYSYDSTLLRYVPEFGGERSITNYHPDSLSTYDLNFLAPVGRYKIGVFNNAITGDLPCGITRGMNIIESADPTFTATKSDVVCHGENGKIFFNDLIKATNTKTIIIQATSASDSVFSKEITTHNGFLSVPFGTYTLKATNDDGCVFDYVGSIEVLDIPQLVASFSPLTSIEINGETYHGTCAYDRFDAEVNITGGAPPYTISTVGPFSNYNQTITLLENENDITLPQLFAGSYQFYISDKNGCSITPLNFEINNPDPIQFPTLNITPPTAVCGGILADGSIVESGTSSGGFPPYQYFYDGVEVTDFDTMGLVNTRSRLTIIDSLGCEAFDYAKVVNNSFLWVEDNGELPEVIPCGGSITYEVVITGGTANSSTGVYQVSLNGIPCADNPNCVDNNGFFFDPPAYFSITVDDESPQVIEVIDYESPACTVSIVHQFDQVKPIEVTGVSAIPPACSDGIYYTTFYLKNLPDAPFGGGGYDDFQYNLDGVTGFGVLNTIDGTPATDPKLPLQFTLPVTGAGVHQMLVTDLSGCGNPAPYEFSLEAVSAFNFSLTSSENLVCHGDTTGAFSFNLNGDTPYETLIFRDGNQVDSLSLMTDDYRLNNLLPGTYTVQATDYKGCSVTSNNIIITEPAEIQGTLSSTSTIDCTGENGVVEVSNISGGTAPYNFSLNGQPFQTMTTLTGGFENNNLMIKDVNNCFSELILGIPLAGPTLFPSSIALLPEAECELGKTIIELQPGFTFPIKIDLISDPDNYVSSELINYGDSLATEIYLDTISELTAGTHYILIRDGLGCEKVDSFVVATATPLSASITSTTQESCHGQSEDGTITISAIGGAPPYMISIGGEAQFTTTDTFATVDTMIFTNTYTVTGLSVGTYFFEVEDTRGCRYNLIDSISAGSLPLLNFSVSNYAGCALENLTADVEIHAYNGDGSYTYLWEDGSTDSIRTDISPDDYNVTITDLIGCTSIGIAYVYDLDSLNMTLDFATDVVCQADSTGQIKVSTLGGFPPYQFSIDGGNTYQADSLFTGLGIGNYDLLVKDDHDCLDTASAVITFTNPLIASVATTNELCKDGNDGTLEITVAGGIAPFSYSIDNINFQAQNIFTNLEAGNYSAWVQDGSGCKAVYHNNVITEPTILTLTTSLVANETCNQMNGSSSGIASGGTPPLTYKWDGDANLNNPLLENAAAGLHTLKVTDANFCTVTSTVTIGFEAAPELVLENSQSEICGNANGWVNLKITNGVAPFSFQWSHDGSLNDSLATDLSAGNYSVTVTDANACTDILTTSINEITGPSLILENSQSEICGNSNGSIDLRIANGVAPFLFQWSHDGSLNDSLAIDLSAGNYSVTVTDANACTDILTTSISEIAGPTLSVFSKTNSLCIDNNGEIVLAMANGTAPFSYIWSHDATLNNNTATNLSGGNYSMTVTDSNGCSDIIFTSIDFDNPQILISSNITHAVCGEANGAIQLSVSGGVTQPYSYVWSHDINLNSTLASELLEGNYSVTVSDVQGCSSILNNIIINNSPAPILSIASFNNTDCLSPMGNITVQATGGVSPLTYEWSHDPSVTGIFADGLSSGNYTITVTDANGCKSTVTQSLIEFEGSISITNTLECSYDTDGSLLISLQGDPADYDYVWNDSAIPNFHIASNLSKGIYTVTVTNSNGCTQDFSIELNAPDEILANVSNVIPVGCGGNLGSATVTPTGGTGNYTYNWNDPDGQTTATASSLPVGNYTVLIIDANGCTSFENVEIIQSSEIILTQGTMTHPLCSGDESGSSEVIATQGFPPYDYLWSNGQTTSLVSNLGAGDYTVTITDAVGCTQMMTTTIDEPMALVADGVLVQEPLCFEGNEGEITVSLSGGTAPYQYLWDDDLAQMTDTATNLVAGNYNVTITDINGCSTIADVEITQPTALQITNTILQKPSCVNNLDGSIEVVIEGGTLDYEYIWNGGAATNNNTFTNIGKGDYMLEVIDNNGCSILENIVLEDPDSILLVLEILTPVSCEGTPNGQIEILAEGGDQNISYVWDNGMNNNSLENLPPGNYEVSITDGLGCELVTVFEIESIDIEPLDLGGEDTLLCNNGMLYYDFSNTGYVEFSWGNLSEGELSNADEFTTQGEDIYYLHALRNDGCLVEDTIQIRFAEGNLDAFFIAPTDIVVGDTIVVLELTLPIPSGVAWEYDETKIELVEQRDNQYLFYFSETGEYDLKLISTLGGCQSDITKQIFVYADSTEIPFFNTNVPTITDLNLFPNPNDGIFTIDVELANVNDMVIDIFNEQSMLVDRNVFTGKDIYSKNYQLDLPTGIYYVIVQVAGARRSLTFVID
ncbi:MAG: hypothetical protein AB8H03_03555 [Saprospiraceae bacterium]